MQKHNKEPKVALRFPDADRIGDRWEHSEIRTRLAPKFGGIEEGNSELKVRNGAKKTENTRLTHE